MYKLFQMPHILSMEHVRHASPLDVELNGLDKAALKPQRVIVFYTNSNKDYKMLVIIAVTFLMIFHLMKFQVSEYEKNWQHLGHQVRLVG